MSPDSITIDLDQATLEPAVIDAAEDLANRVVAENRAVRAWFPSPEEAATLPLRKVPEVEGKLRVVEVENFDINACGGTHAAHTGEIGIIKIVRVERRGDKLRVEFRCGERALLDYRQKNNVLNRLAADLTTAYTEIPAVVEKMREDNKTLRRDLKALQSVVLGYEAENLRHYAEQLASCALIVRAFSDRDLADIRVLAQKLIEYPQTVVLLGLAGEKAQLFAARSEDLEYDMVPVLLQGLAQWGVQRGGGRPSFAQGGGKAATMAEVEAALTSAAEALRAAQG